MAIDYSAVKTRMDVLNERSLAQQAEDARRAAIRARPAWELMRLREQFWPDGEDKPELFFPVGTVVLRINHEAHLKAFYWPNAWNYDLVPGTTFMPTQPLRFDRELGFILPDKVLSRAYKEEAALPRKCLHCGAEAYNRGLFSCEEPVFFCDVHYNAETPMLLPGDGYRESTRADRM